MDAPQAELKDRCADVLLNERTGYVLRCEKLAGHSGVHEADGIEWWEEK